MTIYNHFVPTGIKSLDAEIGGLEIGKLTFVTATPRQGKTAFIANVIANTAVSQHIPTAFFSIKIEKNRLFERLAGKFCNIKIAQLREGYFSQAQYQQIIQPTLEKLQKSALYIDDTPAIDIEEICRKTRRLHKELSQTGTKLKLLAIDSFQLIKGAQKNTNHILGKLRELAQELQIAVLIPVQCKQQFTGSPSNLLDLFPSSMQIFSNELLIFIQKTQRENELNIVFHSEHSIRTQLNVHFNQECGIITDK